VIELGQHAAFIVWSYVGTGIVLAIALLMVVLASRRVDRRLADLEARGIRRRSDEQT
jgi:heme exporter protein D